MSVCIIVLLTGQSVQRSGGTWVDPLPPGSYWSLDKSSTIFEAFDNGAGVKDLKIAAEITDIGRDCITINMAQAGTSSAEWFPPSGAAYVAFATSFASALSLLSAELAGRTPHWIHFHDQGEFEVNLANPGGSAQVNAWASNALALFAKVETLVGSSMHHVIGLTKIPQPVNNWGPEIRVQQRLAAGNTAHTINRDALEYAVDNIHLKNPEGQIAYGSLQGLKARELLVTMGTLSTYLLNKLLDHLLGVAAYSAPATVYFAAFVAGVEVTGGSYARKAETNNTTLFPNAASRAKTNGTDIVWATASATWGVIDEIRIYDASSGGNELARRTLVTPPASITAGDILKVLAGDIDITAPAGMLTDTHVHLMLNHAFGAVAWTAQATTQFAYFAGDPQGAGVEITGTGYTRDTNANDGTSWTTAAGGTASSKVDISVGTAGAADWTQATYWALFDNAGTGLMMSAALPAARSVANGQTETITAGRLQLILA